MVIVPIVKKEADAADVMQAVDALHTAAQQAGLRCKVDASTEKTPGWKFNHYEMKVSIGMCVCPECATYKAANLAFAVLQSLFTPPNLAVLLDVLEACRFKRSKLETQQALQACLQIRFVGICMQNLFHAVLTVSGLTTTALQD